MKNNKNSSQSSDVVTIAASKPIMLQEQILRERLRLLYSHLLTTSLPATTLCASVVLATFYKTPSKNTVLIWYVISVAIVLLRYSFLVVYHHTPKRYNLHLSLFIIGSSAAAAMWGI